MADYQLELRQVVDYPRCRIYREFMQTLIADRSIRTGGCSGLFYYVVLCSYPDIACPVCGGDVNSWDKRCSRALGYRQIVCEGCISEEYQVTVENLRYVMENHFGLVPCPGI